MVGSFMTCVERTCWPRGSAGQRLSLGQRLDKPWAQLASGWNTRPCPTRSNAPTRRTTLPKLSSYSPPHPTHLAGPAPLRLLTNILQVAPSHARSGMRHRQNLGVAQVARILLQDFGPAQGRWMRAGDDDWHAWQVGIASAGGATASGLRGCEASRYSTVKHSESAPLGAMMRWLWPPAMHMGTSALLRVRAALPCLASRPALLAKWLGVTNVQCSGSHSCPFWALTGAAPVGQPKLDGGCSRL